MWNQTFLCIIWHAFTDGTVLRICGYWLFPHLVCLFKLFKEKLLLYPLCGFWSSGWVIWANLLPPPSETYSRDTLIFHTPPSVKTSPLLGTSSRAWNPPDALYVARWDVSGPAFMSLTSVTICRGTTWRIDGWCRRPRLSRRVRPGVCHSGSLDAWWPVGAYFICDRHVIVHGLMSPALFWRESGDHQTVAAGGRVSRIPSSARIWNF